MHALLGPLDLAPASDGQEAASRNRIAKFLPGSSEEAPESSDEASSSAAVLPVRTMGALLAVRVLKRAAAALAAMPGLDASGADASGASTAEASAAAAKGESEGEGDAAGEGEGDAQSESDAEGHSPSSRPHAPAARSADETEKALQAARLIVAAFSEATSWTPKPASSPEARAGVAAEHSPSLAVLPPVPASMELDPDAAAVVSTVRDVAAAMLKRERRAHGGVLGLLRWAADLPQLPADSGFTELDEAEARHSDSCSITAFVKRAVGAGPGRTRQTQPTAQDLEERAAAVEAAAQEAGRLLTRRAATLETRLNEMRASLASGSGDRHLRSSLQRGLDHVRQQQAQLSSALEAFRMRSFVEAVLGCGLHAARVALAAQRVPVLTLRQDLALCRRHLLIALAEASAVEVDVVGQTGGRLGSNGRDGAERGRIIADMPLQDAELYARQARSLLSEARVDGAADAAVGTSHLRRSFEQLGVALRDTAEAACAGGEERARQEREAVLEHIRKVVPVLAKRMAVDRDLKDKHARLSGDLDRMKEAVANIMASQQAKVVALAEAVANAERRSDLKGEAAVAELAAPLDSS